MKEAYKSTAQMLILRSIKKGINYRAGLAKALQIEPSPISQIINRMKQTGLISESKSRGSNKLILSGTELGNLMLDWHTRWMDVQDELMFINEEYHLLYVSVSSREVDKARGLNG